MRDIRGFYRQFVAAHGGDVDEDDVTATDCKHAQKSIRAVQRHSGRGQVPCRSDDL